MNKKYEFTGETKEYLGRTLHQIRAKISFGNVAALEIGGWIEKEENLSENGNAWVCGDAWVCDDAKVCGDAKVYGDAKVCGDAWVYDDAKVCGDAWVCGNAKVYGNAKVCGDAWVYGNAKVCDDAKVEKSRHYITFESVGSRNDALTAFRTSKGFYVKVGCFLGNVTAFLEKVEEEHGNNIYAQEYRAIAEVIKIREKATTEEE